MTTFTVAIPTTEEVAVEADETYTLTVGGQSGIGTITNDDAAPAPTITAVSTGSAAEGDAVVHTVTVSGTSATSTSFASSLAGGSATVGTDLPANLATATFSNGVTYSAGNLIVPGTVTTFTVAIPTTEEVAVEADETYTLTVGGQSGIGTITNDDAAPAPTITAVSTGSAAEGDAVVHTVTVSGTSATSTSFASSLAGGSATVGTDLPANLATATFSNGVTYSAGNLIVPGTVTTFTVAIPTTEEVAVEADETYTLTVGGQSGIGTITNDDAAPGGAAERSNTVQSVSNTDLWTGTADHDTYIFAASAPANGNDTLIDFGAGASGDLLDVSAYLGAAAAVFDGNPAGGDSFDATPGAATLSGNNVVAVQGSIAGLAPSADQVAALLSALTVDDGSRQVVVVQDASAPGKAFVYFGEESNADGNAALGAAELAQVATIEFSAGSSFEDLVVQNFGTQTPTGV